MLEGLSEAAGALPIDLGVLPDQADRVRDALAEAARSYDVLVVSGGASQGAEDHVARTIDDIGKRHLWQIAIKPGRPMSFGQIDDCVVLGLPGNSGRGVRCFLIYVRPVLARLGGGTWPEPVRYPIAAAFEQTKKQGRRGFGAPVTRKAWVACCREIRPRWIRVDVLITGSRRSDRSCRGGDGR